MAREGRTGDKETDDILDEMEEDGLAVPAFGDNKDDKTAEEESTESTVTAPELEESADETAEEDEEESEDDSSDEDEDEEDDDESDEDESGETDEGEDGDGAKDKKGDKLTLVQKYRKNKKLLRATQAALEKATKATSEEQFDAELKTFAETHGMKIDAAKGLIELAAKRAGLPQEVMEEFKRSRKERADSDYWDQQRKQFDKDFKQNVTPVLESLGLKEADIAATYKTLNEDTKSPSWAWAKGNKPKSLVQLALDLRKGKSANRTSSEGGGRRTRAATSKDVSEMSAEDINALSDKEFDEMSDTLGKNSKSVVHRA